MNREDVRRNPGMLASVVQGAAIAVAIGSGGCSAPNVPTAQSFQGLTPTGTVTLTETIPRLNVIHHEIKAGAGGGSGMLTFNGRTYPFQLSGSVIGSGGTNRITLSGEVYKLSAVSDFEGRYTERSGSAGSSQDGHGHLWLQNDAGVIMHLYSTVGILLSVGEDDVIVRLAN